MIDEAASRRNLLAAAVAGSVAGCSGLFTNQKTDEPSNDQTTGGSSKDQTSDGSSNDQTSSGSSKILYVAPDGSDDDPGTEDAPVASIQTALERANPGQTVQVEPGEYVETVRTVRDGEPDAPITITGPPEAVLRPPPATGSVVRIHHHHTHLRGLTINGLIDPDRRFEEYEAWARNCVFVTPEPRAEEGVNYLSDVVVEPSGVGNTRKPIIQTQRIRDTTIGNFEVIGPAGMRYDPRVNNHEIGHVREIVYIGSPEPRRNSSYWPYDTIDRSQNVRIHHIDNSAGYAHNEFVDVKLGSMDITIEYCTDRNAGHNTEAQAEAAIILNGNDCTVRWNDIGQCPIPISVSPWAPSDDIDSHDWGQNHEIYGNHLHDFGAGPFQFRNEREDGSSPSFAADQRVVCGNQIDRGSLDLDPWIPPANGFDGTIADRSGQDEVTITVGAGSNGQAFDPPAVTVDPGTTVTWEWTGEDTHYVVRRNRVDDDPETVPDPISAPHLESETFDDIGLQRWACYEHHDEEMRVAVLIADTKNSADFATLECESSLPENDGIGHTGGDNL